MPLCRYITTTAVGTVTWATVYTTIGMVVLTARPTRPAGRLICLLMLTVPALIVTVRRSQTMHIDCGSGRREYV